MIHYRPRGNFYKKKSKYRAKIIVVIFVFAILFFLLDCQLRPIIKSVAADQACVVSTDIINNAVIDELSKQGVEYSDLIKIERDSNGKILALNTDIQKVNLLKSIIADRVQDKISAVGIKKVNVPIGTLTGTEVFTGRGPSVKLKITMSGSIITELKSNFSSAGINQTRHQIYMSVSTKVFALIPGYPTTTAVETNIAIAETVIVGDVPKVFAGGDPKTFSFAKGFSNASSDENES